MKGLLNKFVFGGSGKWEDGKMLGIEKEILLKNRCR